MFKASKMETYEPGNTIPDQQLSSTPVEYITGMFTKGNKENRINDNVVDRVDFERIKAAIQVQQSKLNDVKADQLNLEAAIDKERQMLADQKAQIEKNLQSLEEQIVEHMGSIYSLPYLKQLIDNALEKAATEPPTEPSGEVGNADTQ